MSQDVPEASENSMLSRILQRASGIFGDRQRSLFIQDNHSNLTVCTTNTALPMYSPVDPGHEHSFHFGDPSSDATSSSSVLQTSQLTHLLAPPYIDGMGTPLTPTSNPTNSARRDAHTHSFPVHGSKAWATLHLYSPLSAPTYRHSSQSTHRPNLPHVYGGRPLEGLVELNLEKQQRIHEIRLSIKGKIVLGAEVRERHTIINETFLVWNKSLGDPRNLHRPGTDDVQRSLPSSFDEKLLGVFSIPFSFTTPTDAKLASNTFRDLMQGITPFPLTGHSPTTPSTPSSPWSADATLNQQPSRRQEHVDGFGTLLPPSFIEHEIATSVRYEVHLHINHGRFRPETKITTAVVYVPTVAPPCLPQGLSRMYEAMSAARHDYHGATAPTPNPIADPASWFKLPVTTLKGSVSSTGKPIKVECNLYLAQPRSYTRGTVIPCFISVSSDDAQLLNELCIPSSPHVRLTRILRHPSQYDSSSFDTEDIDHIGAIAGLNVSDSYVAATYGGKVQAKIQLASLTHRISTAVWWKPSKDIEQHTSLRHLAGEIHLPHTLPPSSLCSFFGIQYYVEMLPFFNPSFSFEVDPNQVLVSQVVEIASTFATEGPVPIAFTQPPQAGVGYERMQTSPPSGSHA